MTMEQLQEPAYIVWLNEQTRIASFHWVKDYRREIFSAHTAFMLFLQSLQEQGYRFQ